MTVIAAVARHGRVFVAADDVATEEDADRYWPNPPKVRRADAGGLPILLAYSGAAELLPVFVHQREFAAPGLDLDVWAQGIAYALTEDAAELNPSCLTPTNGSDRASLDGMGLVAHAGRIWTIDANIAALIPDGIIAIGSGGHVAFGYLHAALVNGADPCIAVCDAVRFACRHTVGCQLLGDAPVLEVLEHP